MTQDAQVLIIGGGAMGVSLMYHLVKAGWQDVVLTEKNDLTHGSTWHAAGLCTHFSHNPTIQELRATSVRLYRDILPQETGENCGFHPSGAMRITVRTSASIATPMSNSDENSAGLWLMPSFERTNSMAVGKRRAIAMASCPAPLGISRKGREASRQHAPRKRTMPSWRGTGSSS